MSTTAMYVDQRTGEITPPETVERVARDYASAMAAYEEARAVARRLEEDVRRYREDLIAIVPAEGRIDAGDAWVVMSPPDRPAQRVDRIAAARFREQLLDLGLGKESLDFHAPTASEVRKQKDRVIAAGLPLDELLPEPVAGPPTPRIVPK